MYLSPCYITFTDIRYSKIYIFSISILIVSTIAFVRMQIKDILIGNIVLLYGILLLIAWIIYTFFYIRARYTISRIAFFPKDKKNNRHNTLWQVKIIDKYHSAELKSLSKFLNILVKLEFEYLIENENNKLTIEKRACVVYLSKYSVRPESFRILQTLINLKYY